MCFVAGQVKTARAWRRQIEDVQRFSHRVAFAPCAGQVAAVSAGHDPRLLSMDSCDGNQRDDARPSIYLAQASRSDT